MPILSSRNRASPTSVLANEKVMLEKEPNLVLAEEKEIIGLMSSPAEEEGGIASAGNIVDNMSGCVRARLKWCPRS